MNENMDQKEILFDAEKDEINSSKEDGKTVLYDAEEAIKEKEKENRADGEESKSDDDYVFNEDEQQTVFKDGLNGGQFIPKHACPMCGFGKKSISELYTRKRFSRKKTVIGYSAICANCGFVTFYATNINELLKYFRGKA